jgi:hypothetical protein
LLNSGIISMPSTRFAFSSTIAFAILLSSSQRFFAADATTQLLQATCKLANKESTATCFLIARPVPDKHDETETILVTAAHVFEKMTGEDATLVLRKAQPDGSFARLELPVKVRSEGKTLWTKHQQMDVAVLRVKLPETTAVVPLPFSALAGEEAIKNGLLGTGEEVRIAGFPIQVEANGAGFPILRRGTVASFPLVPIKNNKTFLVDYNVFAGDSGGPVWVTEPAVNGDRLKSSNGPLIVGLLHAQVLHDEKTKLVYEERLQHHRMGLGIIIHAEFIRQTIDMLK